MPAKKRKGNAGSKGQIELIGPNVGCVPQLRQWQQANAIKASLEQRQVSLGARVVLVHLCLYLNTNLECFPSQATLAASLGVDQRTVRRLVAELSAAGLIEVIKPWKINHYRLVFLRRELVNQAGDEI